MNNVSIEKLNEEINRFWIKSFGNQYQNENEDKGTNILVQEKNRIGKETNRNESKDANNTRDMLHGEIEEMIDHRLIRDEELQEVINEQQKDSKQEGIDITSNPYGLYNAVVIG